MSLLEKRLKKNLINKEINKTINSLTTEENKLRTKKQPSGFMTLDQYISSLTKDNFKELIDTDIDNRIRLLGDTPKAMSKNMSEYVLILELFQNLKKEIGLSKLTIQKKKTYGNVISEKQKQILKITNDILEYRRLNSLEEEFINRQVVSIAMKNIKTKHLDYITSVDTSDLESNLKVILNEIHIVLVDQLYREEKAIIQYKKENNKKFRFIQYPHPKKIWQYSNIEINLENAESQIHNISQYMDLLFQLKQFIKKLPSIKRIGLVTRNTQMEKFSADEMKQIRQNLLRVVDDATKKIIQILLNPYFDLIKSQRNNNVINYFTNPYIEKGTDKIFVYDVINEFSALVRDTQNSNNMMYMFENLYKGIIDHIDLFDGPAGRLERVKMINWITQIEDKYNYDYYNLKKDIALEQIIYRIVLNKKKQSNKEITLSDILSSMPKEKPVNVKKEVQKLVKNMPKDKWAFLKKQILITTWNMRKQELPLSWYKIIAKTSSIDYLLVHFTGFFYQYQHIYGVYPYEMKNDSIEKFREWQKKRIDNGKFFNEYIKHYVDLNNKKFLFFNKTTGLIDVDMNKAQTTIQSLGQSVRDAYDNVVKLLQLVGGNVEHNSSIQRCRHEDIQKEIDELIKIDGTQERVAQLDKEKQECQIQTDQGMVCKFCSVRLEQILDSAPETYDEMERRRFNQQLEDIEVGYQEIQRQELEKKMISLTETYMNDIIKITNASVKTVISNLDTESRNISRQEVDKIKREIVMIIMSNERNIFNSIQNVYAKHLSKEVDNQSIKFQIMNDIVKMLVVIYYTRKFAFLTPEIKTPINIQKMYNDISTIKSSLQMDLYDFEFQLNYPIIIYNQAVSIYNNSENDHMDEDNREILESNINNLRDEELEIVTATFGISKETEQQMINELKMRKVQTKKQGVKETDEIMNKIIDKSIETYDERLQTTLTSQDNLNTSVSLLTTIVSKYLGKQVSKNINYSEYKQLFENLFYWSRPENQNNPTFEEYKEKVERLFHPDISNLQLLNQLRVFFNERYDKIKYLIKIVNGYNDLLKINVNDTNIRYMNINNKAYLKGKKSEIELHKEFILNISLIFGDNHMSLVLLNKILNNKIFQNKILSLQENYGDEIRDLLLKINNEYDELVKVELLYKQYETTEIICPICPSHISESNINISLHLQEEHGTYISGNQFQIIRPMKTQCPYCPYNGKDIYTHIKNIHIDLTEVQSLYQSGMEKRYDAHLRILWEKHGSKTPTLKKMENLDNKINLLEIYQTYCDQNIGNNLKLHKFENSKCLYCNRTFTKITADGINYHLALKHATNMKNYIEQLNKRYCLKNNYLDIAKISDDCLMKDLSLLIPSMNRWELLRKVTPVHKILIDTIINKVKLYKQSLLGKYRKIKPDGNFENESLDVIDQIYNMKIDTRDYILPIDTIQQLYKPYEEILSDKTIKTIFKSKQILKWQNILNNIDHSSGNMTIKDGKKKIKELVVNNAQKWLKENVGDIEMFENQIGMKLPIMKMEKYREPLLKGDRTKQLVQNVRSVILNLSKLNNGILNPYMHNTYLLSQSTEQQGGSNNQDKIKPCKEKINIISQEKWENENLDNLIYIKWPTRTDCYLTNELLEHLNQSQKMVKWVPNTKGKKLDNKTGMGYVPKKNSEKYIALYPVRNWVSVQSLKQILNTRVRHFKAVSKEVARLGNENGSFGASEKHAQEEEPVWILKFDWNNIDKYMTNEEESAETDLIEESEESEEERSETSNVPLFMDSEDSEESGEDIEINLGPITSTTQIGGCDVCTI